MASHSERRVRRQLVYFLILHAQSWLLLVMSRHDTWWMPLVAVMLIALTFGAFMLTYVPYMIFARETLVEIMHWPVPPDDLGPILDEMQRHG